MLPLIIASILSAPPGWNADPDHAAVVQRDAQAHLPEGIEAQVDVESYLAPIAHGAQLIASQTVIAVNGEAGAGGLTRSRIEDLKALPDIGKAGGDSVRTVAWSETPDDAGKLIEARLEYADDTIGIVSLIRKVWIRPAHDAGKPDMLIELEADCEIASDQAATLRAPCEQALATLTLPPVDQRLALSAPAAAPPAADDDDADEGSGSGTASASGAQPSTIGPAPAGDLPTGPIIKTIPATDDSRDMRPFYIGGALVLMAALLLWNRKKRQEMLAEEEKGEERERERVKKEKEEKGE